MSRSTLLAVAVAAATVGVRVPFATAASVPFLETFDAAATGTALPSGFVESVGAAGTTANYSVEPDAPAGNDLQALMVATTAATGTTGVPANASAAVSFPALTAANFVISSEFTIDAFTAGGTGSTLNFGLAARGTVANFSSGQNYRLLYSPYTPGAGAGTGRLTLGENGGTGLTGTLSSAGTITPTAGLTGTLTLTGAVIGGTLTLTGTLVSGGTTLTVTGTDASPTAGEFFGYRTALNAVLGTAEAGPLTSSEDIDYDNLSVVPEPAAAGLLGLGAAGLLARRRSRRR